MSDGTPQQGQGCSLPNLLVPVALAAGGTAGWVVGSPHGVAPGVLGVLVGAVLSIPALGLLLTAVVGPVFLWDWLRRRSRPE